jgi:heme-degrading monooxygenase HmoA
VLARSITFHGKPEKIDAGIAFVKNEAVPKLDKVDGARGLLLRVDRETGHCIATSSWESENMIRAGNEHPAPSATAVATSSAARWRSTSGRLPSCTAAPTAAAAG